VRVDDLAEALKVSEKGTGTGPGEIPDVILGPDGPLSDGRGIALPLRTWRGSPESGDDCHLAVRKPWQRQKGSHPGETAEACVSRLPC
jgi:hypothetical protein